MIEHYALIKTLHMSTALVSISLFALRYVWMLMGSGMLRARWVRILPHAVDTLLLVSAVMLAVMLHQYPFVHGWITAKVVALLLYIVLGMIALKRGPTRLIRGISGVLAIATFYYIFQVAVTKQVLPF